MFWPACTIINPQRHRIPTDKACHGAAVVLSGVRGCPTQAQGVAGATQPVPCARRWWILTTPSVSISSGAVTTLLTARTGFTYPRTLVFCTATRDPERGSTLPDSPRSLRASYAYRYLDLPSEPPLNLFPRQVHHSPVLTCTPKHARTCTATRQGGADPDPFPAAGDAREYMSSRTDESHTVLRPNGSTSMIRRRECLLRGADCKRSNSVATACTIFGAVVVRVPPSTFPLAARCSSAHDPRSLFALRNACPR
ncbi:hypothetical protein C8Q78DRAFT_267403 [Trametes maxima]|nr:hypothetical protein C8Q78DRAFT_267403 [Trametes maxima]